MTTIRGPRLIKHDLGGLFHNADTLANLRSKVSDAGLVASTPPVSKCKVTNLYVDPETGKLVVEYDNTPQG